MQPATRYFHHHQLTIPFWLPCDFALYLFQADTVDLGETLGHILIKWIHKVVDM